MKMTVEEIIKKSSAEDMAKIIGFVASRHLYGFSAEQAIKLEYKEISKALQYKMEVDYKPTNADRIRSMSDEELLEFICSIETYDEGSVKIIEGGSALCSVTDVENWLQSEVEE